MRAASLFSGIAGFELGLGESVELALLNEIDPSAQVVLRDRLGDVQTIADVEDVTAAHMLGADLLMAGFPCQDISIVGGQRGMAGERSGLVRHVFRLAEMTRPDRILLENVQSIRFVHGGRVMAYLAHEAERLGYRWAYRILDSRAFGLAQRRRRFYFLASRVDDPRCVLHSDAGPTPQAPALSLDLPIGFYWTEGRVGHGLTADAIPPLKAGSAIGIASPPAVLLPNGRVCLPTIETAERLQGFPAGWTQSAPTRLRWKLVGNAVSPPVVAWIARRLSSPSSAPAAQMDMPESLPWPIAAWGDGKGLRKAVNLGEAPGEASLGRLSTDEFAWSPISHRALAGFIARARAGRLSFPEGFLPALDRALANL